MLKSETIITMQYDKPEPVKRKRRWWIIPAAIVALVIWSVLVTAAGLHSIAFVGGMVIGAISWNVWHR